MLAARDSPAFEPCASASYNAWQAVTRVLNCFCGQLTVAVNTADRSTLSVLCVRAAGSAPFCCARAGSVLTRLLGGGVALSPPEPSEGGERFRWRTVLVGIGSGLDRALSTSDGAGRFDPRGWRFAMTSNSIGTSWSTTGGESCEGDAAELASEAARSSRARGQLRSSCLLGGTADPPALGSPALAASSIAFLTIEGSLCNLSFHSLTSVLAARETRSSPSG